MSGPGRVSVAWISLNRRPSGHPSCEGSHHEPLLPSPTRPGELKLAGVIPRTCLAPFFCWSMSQRGSRPHRPAPQRGYLSSAVRPRPPTASVTKGSGACAPCARYDAVVLGASAVMDRIAVGALPYYDRSHWGILAVGTLGPGPHDAVQRAIVPSRRGQKLPSAIGPAVQDAGYRDEEVRNQLSPGLSAPGRVW